MHTSVFPSSSLSSLFCRKQVILHKELYISFPELFWKVISAISRVNKSGFEKLTSYFLSWSKTFMNFTCLIQSDLVMKNHLKTLRSQRSKRSFSNNLSCPESLFSFLQEGKAFDYFYYISDKISIEGRLS